MFLSVFFPVESNHKNKFIYVSELNPASLDIHLE